MRTILIIITTLLLSNTVLASELGWGFKSPAFHYGNGYSSHVLSVEQLQHNRRQDIKDKADAEARRIERELENTTLNKFIKNVESRIYANLSKQLVDNMFGTSCDSTTTTCPTSGTSEIEGATIYWVKDTTTDIITLTITDANGNVTEMSVPIGDFVF